MKAVRAFDENVVIVSLAMRGSGIGTAAGGLLPFGRPAGPGSGRGRAQRHQPDHLRGPPRPDATRPARAGIYIPVGRSVGRSVGQSVSRSVGQSRLVAGSLTREMQVGRTHTTPDDPLFWPGRRLRLPGDGHAPSSPEDRRTRICRRSPRSPRADTHPPAPVVTRPPSDSILELRTGPGLRGRCRGAGAAQPGPGAGRSAGHPERRPARRPGDARTSSLALAAYAEHERVKYYLDFFQGPARSRMTIWLGRLPVYEADGAPALRSRRPALRPGLPRPHRIGLLERRGEPFPGGRHVAVHARHRRVGSGSASIAGWTSGAIR